MIFQQWQQVLSGEKTQTRRRVRPDDVLALEDEYRTSAEDWSKKILVRYPQARLRWRIKWAEGRTYAVQPGRSKPAVGRIRITAIRQERLQDITAEDALAEGWPYAEVYGTSETITMPNGIVATWHKGQHPIGWYAELWDTIHTEPGTRWADNPVVWVLEFEPVKEGAS